MAYKGGATAQILFINNVQLSGRKAVLKFMSACVWDACCVLVEVTGVRFTMSFSLRTNSACCKLRSRPSFVETSRSHKLLL